MHIYLYQRAADTVDRWLLDSGFPPVIRSEIATQYNKLYAFLLWTADHQRRERFYLSSKYMLALACYLFVCVNEHSDKGKEKIRPLVIEYLYKNLQGVTKDFEKEITRLLNEMVSLGWCIAPAHDMAGFRALQNDLFCDQWDYRNFDKDPHFDYFSRLFTMNPYSLFVLKLFQKEYYETHFPGYYPSREDILWNPFCPWKHDYIVPQQWGEEAGEWSNVVKLLIGCIGNVADISYKMIRIKGDVPYWNHYDENASSLLGEGNEVLFERVKTELQEDLPPMGREAAKDFFSFVRARFLKISDTFSQLIEPLNIGQDLPELVRRRKDFLLSLKERHLKDFALYYVLDEIELPFEEDDDYGWRQRWISLGGRPGEQFVPSVAIGIDQKDCQLGLCVEYGIRKRGDKTCKEILPSPGWWKPGEYHLVKEGLDTPGLEKTILDFMGEKYDLD